MLFSIATILELLQYLVNPQLSWVQSQPYYVRDTYTQQGLGNLDIVP